MNIVFVCMLKNASGIIPRFFAIQQKFRDALHYEGHILRYVFAEGDSQDNTYQALDQQAKAFGVPYTLIKCDHGKRWSGNPDAPERWEALSFVCNKLLEEVKTNDDALIYIESDLIYPALVPIQMLHHLEKVPVVSPMNFTMHGASYETFGHRGMDGQRFGPFPPYHPDLAPSGTLPMGQLLQVSATGSGWAMRGDVARVVRFGEDGPDHSVGLGRSIYKNGYSLYLDPNLWVMQV